MSHLTTLPAAGDLLRRSFSRIGRRWGVLTGLFLVGHLVAGLAFVAVLGAMGALVWFTRGPELLQRLQANPQAIEYLLEDETTALMFRLLLVVASLLAARIVATFLLAGLHAAADDSIGFRKALSLAGPRTWAFLALLILQGLAVNLGCLLLILPGIWIAVRLSLAPQVFATEGLRPIDALKRSFELTRGRFWAVLGRSLLVGLVAGLVMIVPVAGWIVGGALSILGMAELARDAGAGPRTPPPRREPRRDAASAGVWKPRSA